MIRPAKTFAISAMCLLAACTESRQKQPSPEVPAQPAPKAAQPAPKAAQPAPKAAQPAAALQRPDGIPAEWQLRFHDEFDSFDQKRWRHHGLGPRKGAVNVPEAISAVDGKLQIRTWSEDSVDGKRIHKTGMVSTQGRFAQTRGCFQARLRCQGASGMWNAFWLMSSDMGRMIGDPLRAGLEIDIVEHRYFDAKGRDIRDYSEAAFHWDGYGKEHKVKGYHHPVPGGIGDAWHVYELIWDEQGYAIRIDGKPFWKVDHKLVPATEHPLYIILSSEIKDGGWAGPLPAGGYGTLKDTKTLFEIDWVRVWGPETKEKKP
ncbi:MAG: hypothetical protein RL095_1909 [Verrucomicrobiota bacterium]|jgi:beta-glucanase (GH16 family)